MVKPFFTRLASDERVSSEYEKAFEQLYEALVKRAGEKRKERDAELASLAARAHEQDAHVLSREERLGPGGLDPVEVFESLPEPLQLAFEAKDTDALRAFIDSCELSEAKRIMRRMVDSGLWVPEPGQEGALLRDD